MTWGRTSDGDEHRARSKAFTTAAYEGPRGIPHISDAMVARGSRGGAPIWVMHGEGFGLMPSPCTCGSAGDGPAIAASIDCLLHGPRRRLKRLMDRGARSRNSRGEDLDKKRAKERGRFGPPESPQDGRVHVEEGADPDGYAVFGRYPKGFLLHVLKLRLLGEDVRRDDVLHVCSGTLEERWTVDVRPAARPCVVANGAALPFRAGAFKAVMLDPPYSDAYARNLYGVENPRPSWLLREAARVVRPCGRIGILHVAIPFAPPGCQLVRVWPVSTGVGFRIRAFTLYEREQARLL